MYRSFSQAGQDQFVCAVLNGKRNGKFLEIGANHPINISNTYMLEKALGWNGLMVEYDPQFEELYKEHRTSKYVICDARSLDFSNLVGDYDYLQIDLEVDNRSTIDVLRNLSAAMDRHRFAVITFEHDRYRGDFFNTRQESRDIFERFGYVLVFPDVSLNGMPFEDWWVHPDLVNMAYISHIRREVAMNYQDILNLL